MRIADIHLERYNALKTAKKVKKRSKKLKAAQKDIESALNKAKEFHEQAPNSPAATYYAAKAEFFLSEFIYADYAKSGMTGTSAKKQGAQLKEKTEQLFRVQKLYENIISTYRQADWSLAALFRIGSLYDNLQEFNLRRAMSGDAQLMKSPVKNTPSCLRTALTPLRIKRWRLIERPTTKHRNWL